MLWANAVDRFRWPRLPHRVGWIVAKQGSALILLVCLAIGEHWPIAVLFGLALAISVAVATMDIALEALVVETVDPCHRPMIAISKLLGLVAAVTERSPFPAICALLILILGGGLGHVPIFNILYSRAQRGPAATSYSLLFGACFLSTIPIRVAAPGLAGEVG